MSSVSGFLSGFAVGIVGSAIVALGLAAVFPLTDAPSGATTPVAANAPGDEPTTPEVAAVQPELPQEDVVATPSADDAIASNARKAPLSTGPRIGAAPAQSDAPEVERDVKPAPTAMTSVGRDTTPNAEASTDPAPSAMTDTALPDVNATGDDSAPVVALAADAPAVAAPTDTAPSIGGGDGGLAQPATPETAPASPETAPAIAPIVADTKPEIAPSTDTSTPQQPIVAASAEAQPSVPDTAEESVPDATSPNVDNPDESDADAVAEERSAPPAQPIVDGPAFEAFAATFDDSAGKPLLSIVLLDVGETGIERENLLSFGSAVTFAISADDPDARWADDAYRKAGFEVLAMVPESGDLKIGQGTKSENIEAHLRTYFNEIPGAIGLIDRPLGDLYRNIRVVDEVTDGLKSTGRALIVHERFGVNATLQVARSKEVPAGAILRVIDNERDAATIRSALERAALEASKTGGAVVFGRTYPETITTLITWLLSNSARSISIAPISAVITKMEG